MARKKFYEKSALKIMSSLAVCTVLSGIVPVYAADLKADTEAESTILSSAVQNSVENSGLKEEDNSDIIINSRLKEFYNLDKIKKYTGFDYKVPDYVIDGSTVHVIRVFNEVDGSSKLEIQFSNKNSGQWYSIESFKGDPVETLTNEFKESFEEADVSTYSKNVSGIDGIYITITDTSNKTIEARECCKYFAWKNDDVWYCMNYDNSLDGSISEDEIGKIANSLKNPSDISNVSYSLSQEAYGGNESSTTMSIYDKDDLNKAEEILGYSPKLPLKINDNIVISDAFAEAGEYGNSLFSYYSYDKGIVVFIQTKDHDNYEYKDVADTGYARENGQTTKVKADKISMNGIDVYRHADKGDNKIVYQWKEDNMYYFFEIYYDNTSIENSDDIVEEFVNAKPLQ